MSNQNNSRKLTVLFAPLCWVGEMMASIGMAEVLREAGHRCVFAVDRNWRSRLESMGFEVKLKGKPDENSDDNNLVDSADSNVQSLEKSGLLANKSVLEKAIICYKIFLQIYFMEEIDTEPYLKPIIADLKPTIIISDHLITLPSIVTSGIPWIFSWSNSPLGLDGGHLDKRLPPSICGLSTNGSSEVNERYRQQLFEANVDLWYKYRDSLIASGCPPLKPYQLWTPSPFANFYMYPKELDYTDVRPLPDNFYQFDYYKRSGSQDLFELPESLANRSGKLIYLSLGSMGSGDVDLMKRLVSILAKSEHRFIVSKGVKHDKYSLADNMWGARTVPQIKVLPIVDAVITHGGNNTFTETMYFGKPVIVLPLFSDQMDNSQRVQEKGFGVRLDAYECTESELLNAINFVLNDKPMAQRLAKASQRIRRDKQIEKIVEIVENLVK